MRNEYTYNEQEKEVLRCLITGASIKLSIFLDIPPDLCEEACEAHRSASVKFQREIKSKLGMEYYVYVKAFADLEKSLIRSLILCDRSHCAQFELSL